MLPAAFVFTYAGYAGRELAQGGEGPIQKGLLALGLLAAIFFSRASSSACASPGRKARFREEAKINRWKNNRNMAALAVNTALTRN
jgi:hypothetical protein